MNTYVTNKNLKYWISGVLEQWVKNVIRVVISFHYSITPLLPYSTTTKQSSRSGDHKLGLRENQQISPQYFHCTTIPIAMV
jgi:hypothetical protein